MALAHICRYIATTTYGPCHDKSFTLVTPRLKVKTDTIQLRVEPRLKEAAERAAKLEHRTLSNWIEFLILDRCKQLNLETTPPDSKEPPA
jgi:hypothetical protein